MEDVNGYIKTQWDCPNCDDVNEEEGDFVGEAQCQNCGEKVNVSKTA